METRLSLYRRHTSACLYSYALDDHQIEDDPRPQCQCIIVASGRLPNEEGRIRHRPTGKRDWKGANHVRQLWLAWGQTVDPSVAKFTKAEPTVAEAIDEFTAYMAKTSSQGVSTALKYEVFFQKRMLPWCEDRGIRFIKEFDTPITVRHFFESWRNLQPIRGKSVKPGEQPSRPLSPRSMKIELERYRTFLRFCVRQHWLKYSYAGRDEIKVKAPDVEPKYAFTMAEYENILATLDRLQDDLKTGAEKARLIQAFALTLRYTGQRIGDVAMLGPSSITKSNGRRFIELTQQKTRTHVKVPVPDSLVEVLQALPIRGKLAEPYTAINRGQKIHYGREFWFWTGESSPENHSKDWSDDIDRILRRTEKEHGNFEHHTTPHTFRHFFAISMLRAGVKIELVARWLGHSSPIITAKHYGHANEDLHAASYEAYTAALIALEGPPKRQEKPAAKATGKVIRIRKAG